MKQLLSIGLLAALLVGCSTTARRALHNTLYSVNVTTTAAYTGYIELVMAGQLKTNSVPKVSQQYSAFQRTFNLAVEQAQFQTNALASVEVLNLSTAVINQIETAKKEDK